MIAFSRNQPKKKPNPKPQTQPKPTNPLQVKWLTEKKSPFCCKRYLEHPRYCEFSQFICLIDSVDHGMVCATLGLVGFTFLSGGQLSMTFFWAYTSCAYHEVMKGQSKLTSKHVKHLIILIDLGLRGPLSWRTCVETVTFHLWTLKL